MLCFAIVCETLILIQEEIVDLLLDKLGATARLLADKIEVR